METLLVLIIAVLGGFAAILLKEKQIKTLKTEKEILNLELQKQVKKQAIEKERVRTEATKVAFNEAKKKFIERYGKHIVESGRDSAE